MDLVLDTRPGGDELTATREAAPHHAGALIGHPDRVQRPGRQQLRQRERVEAVGLRARLTNPGIARRHDDHPGDMRLEDPRDLPRIAGHLQRHLVIGREALREQLQVLCGVRDSPAPAAPAAIEDRDLAKVAMHVQTDRSHHFPLSSINTSGERWANDIDGFALAAQPGTSQGRPPKSRAHSPSRTNRPAQSAFSQKAPVPVPRR